MGDDQRIADLLGKSSFTVNDCVSECNVANKWVLLSSLTLFTLIGIKHQRKSDVSSVIAFASWELALSGRGRQREGPAKISLPRVDC